MTLAEKIKQRYIEVSLDPFFDNSFWRVEFKFAQHKTAVGYAATEVSAQEKVDDLANALAAMVKEHAAEAVTK